MRKEILEMMRNAGCTEEELQKVFENLDRATDEQIREQIETNTFNRTIMELKPKCGLFYCPGFYLSRA